MQPHLTCYRYRPVRPNKNCNSSVSHSRRRNLVDATYSQRQHLLSTKGIISQSRSFETVEEASPVLFSKELSLGDFAFCSRDKAKLLAAWPKTQLMST